MRPGSLSSIREPSISAAKRPHSWILAFVHWPIGRPRGQRSSSCRDSKDTERTGKGEGTVRASGGRDDELVIGPQSRKEDPWNLPTSIPTAPVTRPSTGGTSWP